MVFRLLAVLIGLAPLPVVELVLRALDVGHPDHHIDPFVGFSGVRPLFVRDATGQRFEIPKARQLCFRPQSFAAVKEPGTFRIFCLGGSTVQGRPFAVETSFTTWLGLSLQAADPSRRWEVVNCGGVSYASYRLAPILEEVLRYDPDLVLLYIGDNEFLESRTYRHLRQLPGPVRAGAGRLVGLRSVVVLREGLDRLVGLTSRRIDQDRPILREEVDALLDYRGGLEQYHRDETWRRGVLEHFEFNLRRMIEQAQEAGVAVLLVNPVANLETPPFRSEHRSGLPAGDRRQFEVYREAARQHFGENPVVAIEFLRRAIDLDDQHAGTWYALGTCLQELGRLDEARAALECARDLDICPLRILGPMNEIVREVAHDTATPLVDAFSLFAFLSPGGIPGNTWLVDHVHPSIEGHKKLAAAIHAALVRQGWAGPPRSGWQTERARLYAGNLAALDDFYYVKGEQRLENLEAWARGHATRLRSQGPAATGLPNPPLAPPVATRVVP